MLGLIDTPGPPFSQEPERPRRRPNVRLWLPLLGAVLCVLLAYQMPPLAAYVLAIAGIALFADGVTSLLPSGDGLNKYRQ